MQRHSNKFFIGAIVGSTIGALTSLLFSTAEGKRIQKKIMKKFHDFHGKNGPLMHGLTKMKNKLMHKVKRKSR
jgi:gas vesicle protein